MKILKRIFLVLLVLIAIPLAVSLFVAKSYNISKEVIVNKSLGEVFDYVVLLRNQDEFSVWAKMDENMKNSYTGVDGQVGFINAWESEKDDVGVGEQEIISIQPNKQIDYELRFIKPFKSISQAIIAFKQVGENKTKVTWTLTGKMNYPMNLILVLTDFKEMIGKDLQEGLNNLKDILEKE